MKTLIVLVVLVALSAVIAAIVVGSRSFEGIVTDHPYEHGLSWDRVEDRKMSRGWSVNIPETEFVVGRNELSILVLDKGGRPLEGSSVAVTVSRPSTTAYDKTYVCRRLEDGSYRTDVDLPLYGYWDLKIVVTKEKDALPYLKRVFAER